MLNISLSKDSFPFGNAMTREILDNPAYEQWFTSRFTVTTFENEMKWYSTELRPNHEDYRFPVAMLQLAEQNGIKVRGHNVFWSARKSQMEWVKPMDPGQLTASMQHRLRSVVTQYAGKVIAWDAVNENLHYDFFESKLGSNASLQIYQEVARLDGSATLFMNEFNTLEQPVDTKALPTRYAAKMDQIRAFVGNGDQLKLAVGLEGPLHHAQHPLHEGGAGDAPAARGTHLVHRGRRRPGTHTGHIFRGGAEGRVRAHPNVQGTVMWGGGGGVWHASRTTTSGTSGR
jgi:hypothetical protein